MKIESVEEQQRIERVLALLQKSKLPSLDGGLMFQLVDDCNWLYSEMKKEIKKDGMQEEGKKTRKKIKSEEVANAVGE
jgi:hypothetical protein